MEQKDLIDKQANQDQLVNPGGTAPGDSTRDENANAGGATTRRTKRNPRLLGGVRARLQAVESVLKGTTRTLEETSRELPADSDGPGEETARSDDSVLTLVRWTRRLVIPLSLLAWAGVVILVLWLAGHISRTILLFVIAALLAYALAPLVTLLERVLPRFVAILIVYLIVLGAVVGLLYLVVRSAVDQVTSLSAYVGGLLTPGSSNHVSPLEQTLNSLGISQSQISSARNQIISQTEGLAGNVVPLLSGLVNTVLDVVVVAVLSIYLLVDGSRMTAWLRRNLPLSQRGRTRFLLETLQRIVGGYIRGQLLLCAIIGVLVGAGMAVLHVPYALLLGVLAFILEFIPILGTLVSGAICVLLALTQGWLWAILVLAYFVIVHVLEGDVLGPRVVGKAIGLHPVVSLLALIAGGELYGITGALLASPVAGVLQAVVIALWSEWREMHPKAFQAMKDDVADKMEKNVADKPVDLEPAAKLLSDTE